VLGDIIEGFAAHRRSEALAMMRVLAAIGPAPVRTLAATAAAQMVSDGQADPPWAAGLGFPAVGRCFGYTDIYGEQRSMVITFRYGRKAHALVVLIDYLLGGGIKDCYVADYTESLRGQYQKLGGDPEIVFSDLDPREAHAILTRALVYEPCPVSRTRSRVLRPASSCCAPASRCCLQLPARHRKRISPGSLLAPDRRPRRPGARRDLSTFTGSRRPCAGPSRRSGGGSR